MRVSAVAAVGGQLRRKAGGQDLAIVQLDNRGQLRFSSYLGGSGDEDNAFGAPALDAQGNLYVSGVTTSVDFPVTPDAIQPTYGGGDIDSLLAKITPPQWSQRDNR